METYETEEQQVEAVQKWWKENGQSAIIGLIAGIIIIFGWNYWQDYKKNQAGQASALYDQLLKAAAADQQDSAEKLAERIQQQFQSTDYALYSGLIQAKIKVEKNDLDGAKTILEKIAGSSNQSISNLAYIRLVRLMMAKGENEQALKLINDIDPAKTANFSGIFDELVGDLYVALDRLDEARSSYQKAKENGIKSPLLQFKIDDLTAPEKIENTK